MARTTASYRIELRASAAQDLRAIVRDIGHDRAKPGSGFRHQLWQKLASLDHGVRGQSGRPGLRAEMYELMIDRSYIAFYRVLEEDGVVEIVQIKHVDQQVP